MQFAWLCLFAVALSWASDWTGRTMDSIPLWNDSSTIQSKKLEPTDSSTDTSQLRASGFKSVRVVVGEGGAEFQQQLRLGIQGEAAPGWFVDGRLVDDGLQAEDLRVSSLQEVNEMYLRLLHGPWEISLGDQDSPADSLLLWDGSHHTKGAGVHYQSGQQSGGVLLGQDPVQRYQIVFPGVDGQQVGYLMAVGGAGYVAVVPGSEKVWWNGELLRSEIDYHVTATGGILDFLGSRYPSSQDQIRVEYEAYGDEVSRTYLGGQWGAHWGAWEVQGGTMGNWGDVSEYKRRVASGDTINVPDDLRMAGMRIKWQGLQVEGAWNTYRKNATVDSLKPLQGRASRWSWYQPVQGWSVLAQGAWQDSAFGVPASVRSSADWESWMLADRWDIHWDDTLPGKRFWQEGKISRVEGVWQPWFSGGFRSMGDSANSRRAESGINLAGTQWKSQALGAIVLASQDDSRRWEGQWQGEKLQGWLRPFLYSRLMRWQGGPADRWQGKGSGGERYGLASDSGLSGSTEFHGEFVRKEMIDSLRDLQWLQELSWSGNGVGLLAHGQWQRQWLQGDIPADYWVSDLSTHWELKGVQGQMNHGIGLTRAHPLQPYYRKVPEGSGDVLFDSLTGQYVEGVDNGNYIRDGWERLDSLPLVTQSENHLNLENWWTPREMWNIQQGILRDIRVGFIGNWSERDSTKIRMLPPWRWQNLENALEGRSHYEGALEWNHEPWAMVFSGSGGAELVVEGFSTSSREKRWWMEGCLAQDIGEHWHWQWDATREIVKVQSLSSVRWSIVDIAGKLRKTWAGGYYVEPRTRARTGEGAHLWQEGGTFGRDLPGGGSWHAEYSATIVSATSENLPWRVMEGFVQGVTHRLESQISWKVGEKLDLDGSYLLRWEPGAGAPFQKLSGEAKAYF